MNRMKIVRFKRKKAKSKGGGVTLLRAKVRVSKNGLTGAAVRIPQTYIRELRLKPGESQCFVTLMDDGKIVIEPIKAEKTATEKAS